MDDAVFDAPFDSATIRDRVVAAWAASPVRFREDANAEEDAALGAYRDRLIVELLQNAVDAAATAGVPARVRIRLSPDGPDAGPGGLLEVANTGAPLTAAGVEALSTLRASAKRDDQAIGRFGAGFAAVLAVTDTPQIVSRAPGSAAGGPGWRGVAWSRERTAGVVDGTGAAGLRAELARRAGAVPVLRLPFDLPDNPRGPDGAGAPTRPGTAGPAPVGYDIPEYDAAPGYDTVVRLPLRDAAAGATARELIAALDPTLALVLPGLAEIVVEVDGKVRVHTCEWAPPVPGPDGTDLEIATVDGVRWRGCVRRGSIPAELLADRPVEERRRTGYAARAMAPDGGWPAGVAQVVRAPQPTDEPVGLPALLSVELPLDPSRRHTVPGPLRDWLTDRLADAVVALACHLGAGTEDTNTEDTNTGGTNTGGTVADRTDTGNGPGGGSTGTPRRGPASGALPVPDPLTVLDLVPTGLPVGEVDGRLRDRLLALLPDAPLFPGDRRGRDCLVCDLGPATEGVTALLGPAAGGDAEHGTAGAPLPGGEPHGAEPAGTEPAGAEPAAGAPTADEEGSTAVVDGLLPAAFAARYRRPALDLLGVRRLDSAGVVEVLRGVHRDPRWWAELYPLLLTAPDRDALGALPVPVVVVPDADELDRAALLPPSPHGLAAADGAALPSRMVTGPRGALLPTPDLDVVALTRSGLPLRVVHPDACAGGARDALRTLGALEGTPGGVLRDPAVREAVTRSDPDDDPDELNALATAVLALVDAPASGGDAGTYSAPYEGDGPGTVRADDGRGQGIDDQEVDDQHDAGAGTGLRSPAVPSWLGDLLLPEDGGGFAPAAELVIADGPLDRLLADDAPFGVLDPAVSDAWPDHVLEAVGVLRTFGVLRASDVTLDADEPVLLELDDSDTWVDDVYEAAERSRAGEAAGEPGGPHAPRIVRRFAAVRDLELVDPRSWPQALAELARPPLRHVVLGGDGPSADPSYTQWWLARHALLPVGDGSGVRLPPRELVLPGADPLLTGLFAPAAPLAGVDAPLLRRLGCRLTLDDVLGDPDAVVDLLDRLGDADREISWPAARMLYMAAVSAAGVLGTDPSGAGGPRLDPPLTVRTPDGVFASADVVVIDAPDLLGLVGRGRSALRLPLDRAAEAAHVLGLRLASELGDLVPAGAADRVATVTAEETVTAGEVDGEAETVRYHVHTELWITDLDGARIRAPWRVVGGIGGTIHVDAEAGTDALARALAWRGGQWERRHALAAALRDPAGAALRQAEDDLDDM